MPLALRVGLCSLCGRRGEYEDAVGARRYPDLTAVVAKRKAAHRAAR